MSAFFAPLILLGSSVFLFSTKLDRSRVVTIQKPIVITQERKTPAYFAYQQSRLLNQKKLTNSFSKSTYLANFSVQPPAPKFQLAELKFTKAEYAQLYYSQFRARTIATNLNDEMSNLAYEKVIFNQTNETPLMDQVEDVPALSPSKKWATIRGKFELRDGVGIVDHRIEIKRIEEGTVRELGKIDLQAGSYSIDIESPNGFLIAQIKDHTGLIIGEDRQRLINLQNRGNFLEGPFIRVGLPDTLAANPSIFGAGQTGTTSLAAAAKSKTASTVVAGMKASTLTVSLFDNQKTLSAPTDEFLNISKFSSTIVRFYDPGQVYANTTTIRQTGDLSQTPVFTKKWVDGAVGFVADQRKIQFKSSAMAVLIGRILVDGNPVAGAQAAIESLPGVQPIYFDQFLTPSLQQTETGLNGLFMFIGLEENVYNIAALIRSKVVGSQLYIAETDSVAFQNIESLSVPNSISLRTFDAFTSQPVPCDVLASFQEEPISVGPEGARVRTNIDNNISEFVIYPQNENYKEIRYVQSGKKDYLHAGLISDQWVSQIKKYRLINDVPATGVIVGFTPSVASAAYLVLENYAKNNLVYFSPNGEVVTSPMAGGGFILYNVPIGAREVVLQDASTDRIYSQVFNVMNDSISVTQFSD